jgi:parallel beta-helix repeat protein
MMNTRIVKQSIVVTLILVFIGASVVSGLKVNVTSNQPMSRGNWFYVGGNGPGNYTSIQKAIDNSSNGDTIYVYNKTYNENLDTKAKKITLKGENRDITFIQGQGTNPTLKIGTGLGASDVTITGFTIIGVTPEPVIQVTASSSSILINHNLIQQGAYGVAIDANTNKITVSDNIISNQVYAGIQATSTSYDVISTNLIEKSGGQGIDLGLGSNHNSILNNTIVNNAKEGIFLEGLGNKVTLISGNNISNNQVGIRFTSSGTNTIINNNIQGSAMEGLLMKTSSDDVIEFNNFIGNKRQASYQFSSRDTWDANYWSNWIGFKLSQPLFQKFPKAIFGFMHVYLDMHPQHQPYNITA